ncbi:hypothetical protein KUTeg_005904 [Tegillarca granosa]|uniref:Core-binding (CB) domain-containing protein n=1 Tax=Tegillarca granosa TaxID=220873 RepID=A0ABQ9FJ15_TEGGR|nr:hypothetical protein KUTeg_005904 [Tegillarca granosa]
MQHPSTSVFSQFAIESRKRQIIGASLADESSRTYKNALKMFDHFRSHYGIIIQWPPNISDLNNFIAFLSLKGCASSTIRTYISAIGNRCKMLNFTDTTKSFIVKKMLIGLTRLDKRTDIRMPITVDILKKIVKFEFEIVLFSAIFSLAFFGVFRIGELVVSSINRHGHALQSNNIHFLEQINSLEIFIPHSKTDQSGKGSVLLIPATYLPICAVKAVKSFMNIRPQYFGTFFCHLSGQPVSRYQFNCVLRKCLNFAQIDSKLYKSHSFRIGAATTCSILGVDENKIAELGRWKSNSYKSYIRIKHLLTMIDPPKFLVLHCSGNDIGSYEKSIELMHRICCTIKVLWHMLPNTKLIWSQILPRLKWRNERNHKAVNKSRVRINSYIAKFMISNGGLYIRYPEIVQSNDGMFDNDKVHLSQLGNDIFLYRLQQALQVFITSDGKFKRKSTDGLSILMFVLAIIGNLTYGLSILVRQQNEAFLIQHLPWLVGSAFLIPFLFFLITCGMSLYFFEVSIGQFLGGGVVYISEVAPIFRGLGFGMLVISVICAFYYNNITSWILYYLVNSFFNPLPWSTCGNSWNSKDCVNERYNAFSHMTGNANLSSLQSDLTILTRNSSDNTTRINNHFVTSEEEFWERQVLQMSSGLHDMVTSLGIFWFVIWQLGLSFFYGVKSAGKVTATLPYLLLTVLIIRGLTLPGGIDGIAYYLKPNFLRLLDKQVWLEAALQVFYSLGPCWGGLITMSSYLKFSNNCLRDAMVLTLISEGTSLYGGMSVFAILGFMATNQNLPIDQLMNGWRTEFMKITRYMLFKFYK